MKHKLTLLLLLAFTITANAKDKLDNFLNVLNAVNQGLQDANKSRIIGYDTTYKMVTKDVVVERKYMEDGSMSNIREIFVHSCSVLQDPKTVYTIKIPQAQRTGSTEKKVVGVSYWISVDQSARECMNKAISELTEAGVKCYMASKGLGTFSGTSKIVANFVPKTKENIRYRVEYDKKVVDKWRESDYRGDLLSIKSDYGFLDISDEENVYFCMHNGNLYTKVLVYLAYTFIYEIDEYETRQVREIDEIRPIYK